MKEELKIVYQHYIPDGLIVDFEQLELDKYLDVEITTVKEDKRYSNFGGSDASDIIIYIKQHATDLIVGGLLVHAAYDILKSGLKLLLLGLAKLTVNKLQGGKAIEKHKSISVRLINNDRVVEIILDSDVKEKQADKIINESFQFISSGKLNEAFNNPDLVNKECELPEICITYNKEKQLWLPVNYSEHKRIWDEYMKRAEDSRD